MQQDTFVKERTALAAQPEQGEDTIDLLELFMGLLAHWTLIAATAVVGAVLMALYTFFLVTPMYKATATIYVVSRNDSVLNFSDLQVGEVQHRIIAADHIDGSRCLVHRRYQKKRIKRHQHGTHHSRGCNERPVGQQTHEQFQQINGVFSLFRLCRQSCALLHKSILLHDFTPYL